VTTGGPNGGRVDSQRACLDTRIVVHGIGRWVVIAEPLAVVPDTHDAVAAIDENDLRASDLGLLGVFRGRLLVD
jgi:hypothetical protein